MSERELKFRFPAYFQGLTAYLEGDNRNLRSALSSPELTMDQRCLLQVRTFIKAHNYLEALQRLSNLSTFSHPFFRAEKFFLQASLASFASRWAEGFELNVRAYEIYTELKYRPGQFRSAHNAASSCINLGKCNEALQYLEYAKESVTRPAELASVFRAQACLFSQLGDLDSANSFICEALEARAHLNAVDRVHLDLVIFDLAFKNQDFKTCASQLALLRKSRVLRYRARIIFDNQLFKIFRGEETQLSRLPKSVEEQEEYGLKWKLLDSLISGDIEAAKNLWHDLHLFLPELHQKAFLSFHPNEEKKLFGQVLLSLKRPMADPLKEPLDGRLAELYSLLVTSPVPLRKEYLIQEIWKIKYSPSYDGRFYDLMKRLKKMIGADIRAVKRGYFLARGA